MEVIKREVLRQGWTSSGEPLKGVSGPLRKAETQDGWDSSEGLKEVSSPVVNEEKA